MKLIKIIKKTGDFDKVFKKGKTVYGKSLKIFYLPYKELKFGFSVSKKHGKAVIRNRIKRLLRAAARSAFKDFDKEFLIVFLPRVQEKYSFSDYLKDMERIRKGFSDGDNK